MTIYYPRDAVLANVGLLAMALIKIKLAYFKK